VQEQPMEEKATETGPEAIGALAPATSEAGAETESQVSRSLRTISKVDMANTI